MVSEGARMTCHVCAKPTCIGECLDRASTREQIDARAYDRGFAAGRAIQSTHCNYCQYHGRTGAPTDQRCLECKWHYFRLPDNFKQIRHMESRRVPT